MSVAAVVLACSAGVAGVAVPSVQAAPAPVAQTASDYHFGAADVGLLIFHVHRDRTADFEAVMQRVGQGLESAPLSPRRDQATGWRFFRARETAESAIYVVVVDPVVREADYDPVKMLTEVAPAEAAALYERLRAAVMRVERLDLQRLP